MNENTQIKDDSLGDVSQKIDISSYRKIAGKVIYSLNFYKDKHGTLCLTEIKDKGSIDDWGSMYVFGIRIAKSRLLDKEEKNAIYLFCNGYVKEYTGASISDWKYKYHVEGGKIAEKIIRAIGKHEGWEESTKYHLSKIDEYLSPQGKKGAK